MPARTTRQEARARILATFATQLDRLIPEDETVPLKGATFADFEDQAETLAQATLPVVSGITSSRPRKRMFCALGSTRIWGKRVLLVSWRLR